jgi:hypothetical protein
MARTSCNASTQKAASRVIDTLTPGEHIATIPVHDRREVDEALSHGDAEFPLGNNTLNVHDAHKPGYGERLRGQRKKVKTGSFSVQAWRITPGWLPYQRT